MSCNKCGCNNGTCGCLSAGAGGTPYYQKADVCPEDHCERVYRNQFSFAVCPSVSWNVPLKGQTALLSVDGLQGASIGSFIWAKGFGYFEITSVDADNGLLGVTNNGNVGNAVPGTQIPQCTCFTVTVPPVDTFHPSDLFPFVAFDFTAPAVSDCIDITVTSINGLAVGDTISIGTGFYTLSSFPGGTVNVIRICNDGDGILPGTPVIAEDQFGGFQYPINVVSNCCSTIDTTIQEAIDVNIANGHIIAGSIWGGTSGGSANAQVISPSPLTSGYITGQLFAFIAGFSNSGATTLTVSPLATLDLKRSLGNAPAVALLPGDIVVNNLYMVQEVSGTFILLNPSTNGWRNTAGTIVINSAVETDLISVTIPGGFFGLNRGFRYSLSANLFNNSGGPNGYTLRIYYGGFVIMSDALLVAAAASGVTRAINGEAIISSGGATNIQRCKYFTDTCAMIALEQAFTTTNTQPGLGYGNAAIDSTADQNFKVTVELSAAGPNLAFATDSQFIDIL